MLLRFFRSEPAAAIVLVVMAALAIGVANSPLQASYENLLGTYVFGISVHHWINDAFMAMFFLLVGLEIKREAVIGSLATNRARILPGLAALAGMTVPALVFVLINRHDSDHLAGWAIPAATDIAFALGILALLGSRVPSAIRVLLVSIAIIDDLLAILVIALFYTDGLVFAWLSVAAVVLVALYLLNRRGVQSLLPYLLFGVVLWYALFESGLHATLAGVLTAMAIPTHGSSPNAPSPMNVLEHKIILWVNFGIVPIFGFANAGISFSGLTRDAFIGSLPLGIALGLFIGKQVGIFGSIWLMVKFGIANMPARTSWPQIYAMAILCGIGFTMSLFIGGLAFANEPALMDATKIGVIAGSLMSAIVGSMLLRRVTAQEHALDQPSMSPGADSLEVDISSSLGESSQR